MQLRRKDVPGVGEGNLPAEKYRVGGERIQDFSRLLGDSGGSQGIGNSFFY